MQLDESVVKYVLMIMQLQKWTICGDLFKKEAFMTTSTI
jgi:hypothetical protein